MDLREQIGQRLVTGFPGTELTEDFRRMVRFRLSGNTKYPM